MDGLTSDALLVKKEVGQASITVSRIGGRHRSLEHIGVSSVRWCLRSGSAYWPGPVPDLFLVTGPVGRLQDDSHSLGQTLTSKVPRLQFRHLTRCEGKNFRQHHNCIVLILYQRLLTDDQLVIRHARSPGPTKCRSNQPSKYLASGGLNAFDSITGDLTPARARADSSSVQAQSGKFGPVVID